MQEDLRQRCILALNAWLHQYASDMCDEESVQDYHQYIFDQGGTLGLISQLLQDLKNAD